MKMSSRCYHDSGLICSDCLRTDQIIVRLDITVGEKQFVMVTDTTKYEMNKYPLPSSGKDFIISAVNRLCDMMLTSAAIQKELKKWESK